MGGFGLMALFFGILTITLTLQVRRYACHTLREVIMELASSLGALGLGSSRISAPRSPISKMRQLSLYPGVLGGLNEKMCLQYLEGHLNMTSARGM